MDFGIFLFLLIVPLGIASWLFLRQPVNVVEREMKRLYKYGDVFLGLVLLYSATEFFIFKSGATRTAIFVAAGILLSSYVCFRMTPKGLSDEREAFLRRTFLVFFLILVLEILAASLRSIP